MSNLKLILIGGKAEAGKTTTAEILKEKLEAYGKKVLITHYGDLLKYICKAFFDWDGKKNEKGRTLLQYVGTDVIRELRPNYWVDFLEGIFILFNDEWDYVLIPDCRFHNECEILKNNGWDCTTVRVNRIDHENSLTDEQRMHPSETDLDNYVFDYYVNSESGIEKLERKVESLFQYLMKKELS